MALNTVKHAPASGSLHLLYPLTGMFFPQMAATPIPLNPFKSLFKCHPHCEAFHEYQI